MSASPRSEDRADSSEPAFPSREEYAAALQRAKLDAMKELAYGASHEINNPLANIAARAQTLLKREHDPEKRRMLQAIHRQAMRAHEMISDLMLFARPPKLEIKPFDLRALVDEVVGELQSRAKEASITLQSFVDYDLELPADRVQLGVALKAMLENSLDAMGTGGAITISSSARVAGMIDIELRDMGPGIPDAIREHLFDPFFSGREAGRGLGFGLSKAWRIVTDHGGTILVDSQHGQGAVFTVRLPLDDQDGASGAGASA